MKSQCRPFMLAAAGFVFLLALGACSERNSDTAIRTAGSSRPVAEARVPEPAAQRPSAAKLAYSHDLDIEMPGAVLEARFERARAACLDDTSFGCLLVGSKIELEHSGWPGYPRATLEVRLPPGQVDRFEASVLAPLPDEPPGNLIIRARSTTAEDLTQAIADLDRRLAQLGNFRDRLTELAARPDAKIDDLIKIESELAETQSQIEALTGQQLHLADRVATERLAISFESETVPAAPANPVIRTLRNAGEELSGNAASALEILIGAGPWLILAGLFGALVRFTWRLLRRKR
jgi:hypothetical protein